MKLPQKLAEQLLSQIDRSYLSTFENYGDTNHYYNYFNKKMHSLFYVEWITGGISCSYSNPDGDDIDPEEEPEIELLFTFVEEYYSNLSHETVTNSILDQIKYGQYERENDNHGGYTLYEYKSLSIKNLSDILIDAFYTDVPVKDYIEMSILLSERGKIISTMFLDEYKNLQLYLQLNKKLQSNTHNINSKNKI